jgi:hypothetical protein
MDDLVPAIALHAEDVEDLHDLGEVGADVRVLQSADLHAGLVDQLRQPLRGHAGFLAQRA